jgi:hypothetical protein
MDSGIASSEVDLGLPHFLSIYTRDMMDFILSSSEVDFEFPHSLA